MAVRDFEAFLRQRGRVFDPNMDVNPGSPFDVKVVQPVVRRLGTDPFTVDISTFISTRMAQAYPDLANQEEDAITDLLNKPVTLLWDPIVRENRLVRQGQSFADPTQMTEDEADALGANFFTPRRTGAFARGPGRIYFQRAKDAAVSPANFFTSKGGLHFFPTERQSISAALMLNNFDSGRNLYYFDVNLISENAGVEYNIGPNELISVSNIEAAALVTNLRKFRYGETAESAEEYVSRVGQSLGERSLVTLRGGAAKLVEGFPEIQRLNFVGFGDAEMQRDVLRGGGLGAVSASGTSGTVTADGEGKALSRRFTQTDVDFLSVFFSSGSSASGWIITIFEAYGTSELVRDLRVRRVVSSTDIDVEEQVLSLSSAVGELRWTLRRRELTLSGIPGGIVFPNTAASELVVPEDIVHVGGMVDTYIRGSDFDEGTFTIDLVTDDDPTLLGVGATVAAFSGSNAVHTGVFRGTDYDTGDAVDESLDAAVRFGYTIQLQEGPNAGNYRVIGRALVDNQVVLRVDPVPALVDGTARRWKLFDVINVDLLNPRETRVTGTDLSTLQNSTVVNAGSGTDFLVLGVSQGDSLVIRSGNSAGEYTVVSVLGPTSLQLDSVLRSTGDVGYEVYRPNAGGSLVPPFIRVTSVELLDSSGQPLGSRVPYARPIDAQSRAFQNPARGVKHDFRNALLGIVSVAATPNFGNGAGQTLEMYVAGEGVQTVTLTTGNASLATAIGELNASFLAAFGIPVAFVQVGVDRLGVRPVGADGFVAVIGGTARTALFGDLQLRTTGDVRTDPAVSFDSLVPSVDLDSGLDLVQVLDGSNVGFFPSPFTVNYSRAAWPSAAASSALLIGDLDEDSFIPRRTFSPEQRRRVQVGSRSLGSARVYFLEPTSFEVDASTVFSLVLAEGGTVNFMPDPSMEHQQVPALPSNVTPTDGVSTGNTSLFSAASQDFVRSGIQPGDKLVIENHPISGTIALPDPVVGLGGLTLVFSLEGDTDRTCTFVRDDPSIPPLSVSRSSVVEQINNVAGSSIARIASGNVIEFSTDLDLVIRGTGTANATILGNVLGTSPVEVFGPEDQSNASPHAGSYFVESVEPTVLTLRTDGVSPALGPTAPFTGGTVSHQTFRVLRAGVQRISATEMAGNVAEAGLYYFDVELVSEGGGDLWNVAAGQQLTLSGYRSDGYYLVTDDPNLTFSDRERPKLVISRSILEEGVDDDPVNATQITGGSLQVSYERSQLVSDVQNFISAETERVICANPLSRHLVPNFVRVDIPYSGGVSEDDVLRDTEVYIRELAPTETLDASAIQKIATDLGASYVQNPLDLLSVVHNNDRTVWVERSQDRLAANSRLSAFIPDRITPIRDRGTG